MRAAQCWGQTSITSRHRRRCGRRTWKSSAGCWNDGTITVRFATGGEQFTPLWEAAAEHPEPGEVILVDEAGLVVARRWCWRQSEESASRENTRAALFTSEAQHTGGRAVVAQALADLRGLLEQYAGGVYESEMVQ